MSYRLRDKPPFAAWLTAERARHGMKADEVARRLRDLGYQAEDSTYRTWESSSGRVPAPETIRALERLFESSAPGEEDGGADLAGAIRELTAYLRSRDEESARLQRELDDLKALVGQLAQERLSGAVPAESPEPAAPRR